MRIGVYLPSYPPERSLESLLAEVAAAGAQQVELGTYGGVLTGVGPVREILDDVARQHRIRSMIAERGLEISALACHGNALHPQESVAGPQRELFRDTVRLAAALGAPTVVDFAGCPGDSEGARHANWVTCPWPTEFSEVLQWQWEEKVIPYWQRTEAWLAGEGVDVAIEMHAGMVVHNPRTFARLANECGPRLRTNLDPSHLIPQQIDLAAAVRFLGDRIGHVHVKDTEMRRHLTGQVGSIDTTPYARWEERGWLFRPIGYGTPLDTWRAMIEALREQGYTGSLSIEHEDQVIPIAETVARSIETLRTMVPFAPLMRAT